MSFSLQPPLPHRRYCFSRSLWADFLLLVIDKNWVNTHKPQLMRLWFCPHFLNLLMPRVWRTLVGLLARKEEEEMTFGDTCHIWKVSYVCLPLSQSVLKGTECLLQGALGPLFCTLWLPSQLIGPGVSMWPKATRPAGAWRGWRSWANQSLCVSGNRTGREWGHSKCGLQRHKKCSHKHVNQLCH